MDSQYTVNQHYIPQFILRNFANSKGLVGTANIAKNPFVFSTAKPKNICSANNLYESQNLDGTYFERNKVENHLACLEEKLSEQFRTFPSTVQQKDCISGENRISIALYIASQVARNPWVTERIKSILLPHIKEENKIIFSNSCMLFNFLPAEKLYEFLENNNLHMTNEEKEKMPNDTAMGGLLNDLIRNCFMFIFVAENESMFYISDNMPLVCKYDDCIFFIPISPSLAVGACPANAATPSHKNGIIRLGKERVRLVNSNIIKNAKRFVVYSPDNAEQAKQDILRYRLNTINY
ncbi:MAG TPA: hypothetical protein DDW30_02205 [Clostridiales bacterium]|nr:hypothetical protein [Clostridiales bacterium]